MIWGSALLAGIGIVIAFEDSIRIVKIRKIHLVKSLLKMVESMREYQPHAEEPKGYVVCL
ncbi:MAG TPA: hypothetical protein PLO78_07965 [Candidatus Omnitrophota bacterium]|nr:hypothetical protein [Candidatus Omnitrophota bacterium]